MTPPIKFGIKKKVLKMFELFSFEVTKRARPKATAFTAIIETITYLRVNESVVQNSLSLNDAA